MSIHAYCNLPAALALLTAPLLTTQLVAQMVPIASALPAAPAAMADATPPPTTRRWRAQAGRDEEVSALTQGVLAARTGGFHVTAPTRWAFTD